MPFRSLRPKITTVRWSPPIVPFPDAGSWRAQSCRRGAQYDDDGNQRGVANVRHYFSSPQGNKNNEMKTVRGPIGSLTRHIPAVTGVWVIVFAIVYIGLGGDRRPNRSAKVLLGSMYSFVELIVKCRSQTDTSAVFRNLRSMNSMKPESV